MNQGSKTPSVDPKTRSTLGLHNLHDRTHWSPELGVLLFGSFWRFWVLFGFGERKYVILGYSYECNGAGCHLAKPWLISGATNKITFVTPAHVKKEVPFVQPSICLKPEAFLTK